MDGVLIAFKVFDRLSSRKAVRFFRELYGYKDYSNNGKYTYNRSGLLDDISHVKLVRGVIIAKRKDLSTIEDFMGKFGAEYHIQTVKLTEEDQKILSE